MKENRAKFFLKDVLISTLYAVIISVILILILAIIVKFVGMSENILRIINQGIKIVSILAGLIIGINNAQKGALKGGIVGLLYVTITIIVFALIEGTFKMQSFNWIDILLAIALGSISGILAVNIKSK